MQPNGIPTATRSAFRPEHACTYVCGYAPLCDWVRVDGWVVAGGQKMKMKYMTYYIVMDSKKYIAKTTHLVESNQFQLLSLL